MILKLLNLDLEKEATHSTARHLETEVSSLSLLWAPLHSLQPTEAHIH